jgi:hypothetical protein
MASNSSGMRSAMLPNHCDGGAAASARTCFRVSNFELPCSAATSDVDFNSVETSLEALLTAADTSERCFLAPKTQSDSRDVLPSILVCTLAMGKLLFFEAPAHTRLVAERTSGLYQ